MLTFRQRLIEKYLKEGKTFIKSNDPKDYVEAVFMISKPGRSQDITDQSQELNKKYRFRLKKDKLGQVIDFIKSVGGAELQADESGKTK